jgi:Transglycosylase-like domain
MRSFPSFVSRRRRLGVVLGTIALGLLATWGSFAAADEIEELRQGVPTGEEVREEIAVLSSDRDDLLTALNTAESDLTATLDARDRLDDEERRLAAEIEAATDVLRSVAVRAFVAGGPVSDLELLLSVSDASDLSWRRDLLRNQAGSSEVALGRLRDLRSRASDEVRESIEQAARLRTEIATLEVDIAAIEERVSEVRAVEPLADAWDRAAIAIVEGSYGIAPADKWAKLRFCESTDNYQAVNSSGKYRGAYQFDVATWQTVGGRGDPAAAPAAEQDARARELYARRGSEPWPECGFYLE